jgi:hypothetical protein
MVQSLEAGEILSLVSHHNHVTSSRDDKAENCSFGVKQQSIHILFSGSQKS